MSKITKITPEQQALYPLYTEKWLAIGLSTEPANRPASVEGVVKAYENVGLPAPLRIIWADSPFAGAVKAAEVDTGSSNPSQSDIYTQIQNAIYGQQEASWLAFYNFFDEVFNIEICKKLDGFSQVAKNSGWWWAFDDVAILTERPIALHRDNLFRLHNPNGLAIEYPDHTGVYSWHGTRVPENFILGQWTTKEIFQEFNAEIRRCAIEKMGWDVFILEAGLEQLGEPCDDPANPGFHLSLYSIPPNVYSSANASMNVLLCTNATPERDGTRHRFGLTVPSHIKTPLAAASWTFNLKTEDYQKMVRAT